MPPRSPGFPLRLRGDILGNMQSFLRNLRFAIRVMVKSPGFTAAVVITLALGIGANAAIFTVTNALLLRPFPYREPSRLVSVEVRDQTKDRGVNLIRYENLRDHAQSFDGIAAWASDRLNLTGDGEATQATVGRVSPNFFSLLGVKARLGRAFAQDEGRPEGKQVVMLANAFWQTRYHGDPSIVGRTIHLDENAYTVIGVLPADVQFEFVGQADIWTPRYFEFSQIPADRLRLGVGYLNMVARLKDGVTPAQANAELNVLNQQYRAQNPALPDAASDVTVTARPLRDLVVGDVRSKVLMLMAAVGVVLLIACANVASLLLSRALARRREVAVRAALGASRIAIAGQLLTESVLMALVAGALGIALAWAATRALVTWGGAQLPPGVPVVVDLRVLTFSLAISLLSGILFGLAPALQLAQVDLNSALREEGRGASAGRAQARMKDALVIGQVALSLVLLIGAGLLLRSFVRLLQADPGFDQRNVLTMNISLSTQRYVKPDQQIAFFDDVLRRVAALPGVKSDAISAALPLTWIRITPVLPQGQPEVPLAQRPFVDIEAVSPEWFETLRVTLRGGRGFASSDQAQSAPVVVVNERFAREYWPNQNPLSQHVVIGRRGSGAGRGCRGGCEESRPRAGSAAAVVSALFAIAVGLDESAGADRSSAGQPGAGHSRTDCGDRRGPAGDEGQDSGRADERSTHPAAIPADAGGRVFRHGAGAGDDRDLRRAVLCGRATAAGVRDPHGARRRAQRYFATGGAARVCAGACGYRRRSGGRIRTDASAGQHAL
jgi:putative ABC transport system permease protein